MLRAGGFRRIRMDFGWGATEREKGKYDFSAYDRLLQSLDENQLRAYWILDYGNTLYASGEKSGVGDDAKTPEFRAAFAKWAAAAVTHFKNRGVVWEIWNEPNGTGFWLPKSDAKDYSALALAACRAIRKIAPDECIIGPATAGIDLSFLETCFRAGLLDWWDGVSVHPYRQQNPEAAAPEYRQLRALIERYKPKDKAMPIISGEWGYSTAWKDFDVERQGKYLPREWLLNQYQEIPISIWYDWHDDGTDEKEPEHHFGTVENAYHAAQTPVYTPKPAYLAAQILTQNLNGFSFNKRLWTGREQDWVLLFTRANEVRLACWTTDATPHEIVLPATDGAFARVGYLGEKLADVMANRQKLTLILSDGVQYLWPRQANDLLKKAAAWPRVPLESFVTAPIPVISSSEQVGFDGDPSTLKTKYIYRDAAPDNFVLEMPAAAGFYQQVRALNVLNPLFATVISASNNRVSVRIDNPTGEALDGIVRVWAADKPTAQVLVLKAGEREKTVEIALPDMAKNATIGVQVLAADNKAQTSRQNVRFVAIEDFARPNVLNDYAALPDGDAKIASTQTLSIATAPEKLLGQDVRALRLDYSWDAGWKFVRILPPNELKIEGQPRAIQMWIYGDGNGHRARLRLRDASGQTLQPNGVAIDWKGWRAVTFPLDGTIAGHWGGADDGIVHGALNWDSLFLLDSAGKSAGTIYLAAPTLVYGAN